LNGSPQQPARPDDMVLADKLSQGAWSHARGQGSLFFDLLLASVVEKIHRRILAQMGWWGKKGASIIRDKASYSLESCTCDRIALATIIKSKCLAIVRHLLSSRASSQE